MFSLTFGLQGHSGVVFGSDWRVALFLISLMPYWFPPKDPIPSVQSQRHSSFAVFATPNPLCIFMHSHQAMLELCLRPAGVKWRSSQVPLILLGARCLKHAVVLSRRRCDPKGPSGWLGGAEFG